MLGTSLIGTESHVRERVEKLLDSGVTTISVTAIGPTRESRVQQLEALRAMLPK